MGAGRREPLVLCSTRALLDSVLRQGKLEGNGLATGSPGDGDAREGGARPLEDRRVPPATLRLKAGILLDRGGGTGADGELNEGVDVVGTSPSVLRRLASNLGVTGFRGAFSISLIC